MFVFSFSGIPGERTFGNFGIIDRTCILPYLFFPLLGRIYGTVGIESMGSVRS